MSNSEPDIFEKLGNLFREKPVYFGWFIVCVGVLFLIAAIANADWLFGNTHSFNLEKVEGWVNFFGRNTARIIVGIISLTIITLGIVLVAVSK